MGDVWSGEQLGWDRNPRLVDPAISRLSDAFHHWPTGAILLCYSVRGQWNDRALGEMRSSLASVLPERYIFRALDTGILRLAVDLGVGAVGESRVVPSSALLDDIDATVDASTWAFDRAVTILTGRDTGVPGRPPTGLPEPDLARRTAFRSAEAALGPAIAPERNRSPGGAADWSELRHVSPIDVRERFYSWSL